MTIGIGWPLAVAAALLLPAAALHGLHGVDRSLDHHARVTQAGDELARGTAAVERSFDLQVQAWRTLLRGRDPQALDQHWGAFVQAERETADATRALSDRLPGGDTRALVEHFAAAHATLGRQVRQGLDVFRAAGFDPAAGDAALPGIDREPARLLAEATASVATDAATATAFAAAETRTATAAGLQMMLAVGAGVLGGGVLGSSARLARATAAPRRRDGGTTGAAADRDGSAPADATGLDDTATLLRSLRALQTGVYEVVGRVREDADALAAVSAEIAEAGRRVDEHAEAQVAAPLPSAVPRPASASTPRRSADDAASLDPLAPDAPARAQHGGEAIARPAHPMQRLDVAATRIPALVSTVDVVALQTELRALNAALATARVGAQRRGAATALAGRLQTLAQRSSAAAQDLADLIGTGNDRSGAAGTLAERAGAATLTALAASIERVVDAADGTGAAPGAPGARVADAIGRIDEATQSNAALADDGASAVERVGAEAQRLVTAVAGFAPSPLPADASVETPGYRGVERRGPNRATNVARPAFGSKAAVGVADDAGRQSPSTDAPARKTGTDGA